MSRNLLCIAIFVAWAGLAISAVPDTNIERTGEISHQRLMEYRDAAGNVAPVRTKEDWRVRRAAILAGMQEAMGSLPKGDMAAPLDVKEERRESGDGYTRLSISFAAHLRDAPADRVPAHLYLPKGVEDGKRRPAMLALHQTSKQGKKNVGPETTHPRLAYASELARRGYVVLAPDYPSFGDYEFDFAAESRAGRFASGTMKGIFNHMRAVDLLCERREVDVERIGVIGHSLGGHNALFVAAFDERLKAVVSSCGWTPFVDYKQGKIEGWTSDRYMPRLRDVYRLDAKRVPFDFQEVVAALAPRAFYSNSPLRDDNFDVEGVRKAAAPAAEVYQLHDAAKNLLVRYPDCEHDFPDDVRREAYEFIDRALRHTPPK